MKDLTYMLPFWLFICLCNQNVITINDSNGTLSHTNSPGLINFNLNEKQKDAVKMAISEYRDPWKFPKEYL